MSAWMCSDRHLSALANAGKIGGIEVERPRLLGDPKAAFAALAEQNRASLRARYENPDDMERFNCAHMPAARFSSIAEALKNCRCYAYQACENDGWDSSDAKRYIDELESELVAALPGYATAPWGLD